MWKRVLRIGAGVVFLVLGIAGFFLPILPGILFTFIGLTLLSRENRHARALLYRLRGRVEIPAESNAASEPIDRGGNGDQPTTTGDGEEERGQADSGFK